MNDSIIKPEWVPSGYLDKKDKQPAVKTDQAAQALYHRKAVISKFGFKRRQIK